MNTEKESRFLIITLTFATLFGMWFFSIREVFSPFILSVLIIAFLFPFREHKTIRVLIALTFAMLMIWLFYFLQEVITPFLIAFGLAYLFDPLADLLERRKLSRSLAIFVITAFILGTMILFGLLVVPQLASEASVMAGSLPSYEDFRRHFSGAGLNFLKPIGIDLDQIYTMIENEAARKTDELIRHFTENAMHLSSGLSSLLTQLINIILIPFLTFYFLRDFDKTIQYLRDKTPVRHRSHAEKIYSRVNDILSLYIRGKILAAVVITLITWTVLALLNVKFAMIAALLTGLLSLIPYLGPLLTFGIGILIGLLNASPEEVIVKILIVLAVIQLLDMVIISPKVIGEKLGLHPVLMIFSLFVFGKVLGMLGLLIAIPAAAIIKVFIEEWYERNFLKKEFISDDTASFKEKDHVS